MAQQPGAPISPAAARPGMLGERGEERYREAVVQLEQDQRVFVDESWQ